MSHKAFAFDWTAFQRHLFPILVESLATADKSPVVGFINHHTASLTDPYEGEPLSELWQEAMHVGDLQELLDVALTLYYSPKGDRGVGDMYLSLLERLSDVERRSLLGNPLKSAFATFDPGRMGSYFQSPHEVVRSASLIANISMPELAEYRALLENCGVCNLGVYVTF